MLLLFLILLPLIGAGLLFLTQFPRAKYLAFGISLVQLILSFYILNSFSGQEFVSQNNTDLAVHLDWLSRSGIQLAFQMDGVSLLFVFLTNLLMPLIILSSFNNKTAYPNYFYALILLMQFGLVGLFTSQNALIFYIFWEVCLIPIWLICGIWGDKEHKIKVTTQFFVYTFIGSLFMLFGFIYVFNYSTTLDFNEMYSALIPLERQNLLFWFIFLAFAIKLPMFPFHTWQPNTYTYAPTQGSMLLSGIMLKMAIFGIIKVLIPLTPSAVMGVSGQIVIVLSIVGIVYGSLISIVQNNIKKIVAYSSIAHVGLITAGLFASAYVSLHGNFSVAGVEGALLQSFAHGVNVVGLFYCTDILIKRFGTSDLNQMGGLAKVAPKFAVLFFIIVLGVMAVPLTNSFIGEFILLKSIFQYSLWAVGFAGLTLILCAVYMLRLYVKSMFGTLKNPDLKANDLSNVEFSVLASVAVVILFFGVFPNVFIEIFHLSVRSIFISMIS